VTPITDGAEVLDWRGMHRWLCGVAVEAGVPQGDVEDIVQLAIMGYLEEVGRGRPVPRPLAYLRRCVINRWRDAARKLEVRARHHVSVVVMMRVYAAESGD